MCGSEGPTNGQQAESVRLGPAINRRIRAPATCCIPGATASVAVQLSRYRPECTLQSRPSEGAPLVPHHRRLVLTSQSVLPVD